MYAQEHEMEATSNACKPSPALHTEEHVESLLRCPSSAAFGGRSQQVLNMPGINPRSSDTRTNGKDLRLWSISCMEWYREISHAEPLIARERSNRSPEAKCEGSVGAHLLVRLTLRVRVTECGVPTPKRKPRFN
ncbi:hypothetical protein, unlikely [Trypanosoma congolense IL3000]|uniref:Uncharacterized protein n=1 Tax=Trypanosoma congolense (strain IL3000) TaxID=1068625 RepID=F9W838_TRYCI|nr:hypothetical protein, unlikely [Trypanosoma congolense IL3000]CCD14328.1 hypothetical protein, unlikely [Trypanosoma congolense IL3000]